MKKSIGAKTIIYPSPVLIVGTYDKDGKPNAMTAAWGGVCCSEPPCVTVSLRKATYSYGNIIENKAYTINIPSEKYVRECDYFGSASGKSVALVTSTTSAASGLKRKVAMGGARCSSLSWMPVAFYTTWLVKQRTLSFWCSMTYHPKFSRCSPCRSQAGCPPTRQSQ